MSAETPSGAGRDHADELVSAHLDGELDAETDAWVVAHLADCDECRAAAAAAEDARQLMRAAPPVGAASLVEDVIARRHRLVGTGAAFVGMVLVALGLLAVTASVIHPKLAPDVDELVAVHADAAHGAMTGMRSVDDPGRHYATPVELSYDGSTAFGRQAVYDGQDLTTAVYDVSGVEVSLFQQPGRLDWDELPDGETERVGDRTIWIRRSRPVVVVTEIGDLVVTAVSDDEAAVHDVVASLPEPERDSTLERIHDSCQRLTEIFGLGT